MLQKLILFIKYTFVLFILSALYLCSFISNFLYSVKINVYMEALLLSHQYLHSLDNLSARLKKKHHKMGVKAGPVCSVFVHAHVCVPVKQDH